jgi:Ca-activated chloride channel homolog
MKCEATQLQLTRYALGDLDADNAAMVTAHVESCSSCRGMLSRIEDTLDLLCRALARPIGAPARLSEGHRAAIFAGEPAAGSGKAQSWIFRPHRALAAAAALLIVVGIVAGMFRTVSRTRDARVAPSSSVRLSYATRSAGGYLDEAALLADSVEEIDELVEEMPADINALPDPNYAATPPPPPLPRPTTSRASIVGEDESKPAITRKTAAPAKSRTRAPARTQPVPADPAPPAKAKGEGGGGRRTADHRKISGAASGPERAGQYEILSSVARPSRPGDRPASGKPAVDGGDADVARGLYYRSYSGVSHSDGSRTMADGWELSRTGQYATEDLFSDDFKRTSREKPDEEDAREDEKDVESATEGILRARAWGVNPFRNAAQRPFSTFSIDVDTASYTLARNYMSRGLLPPTEAVRTEEFVNFFDYGYKAPEHETFRVFVDAAPSKFGRGMHLLKIGIKGRRLGREEQRPAMLTFLIDTSGSMDQADRLGLVRKSLRLLVGRLGPNDRIAIVQYDSHARLVLAPTAASEKKKVLTAIDGMQCGGSTNLEEGMARAYAIAAKNFIPGGENRVLLLSDGVANLGAVAAEDILKRVDAYRKQGITCSVFGFGMGSYDDEMLETLANKGDGNYTFVDSEGEARRVFVDDLSATLNTIAADVKIQVEFNPKRVKRYRQMGYENRQLKDEQFRDDTVDAGEVGSGQSVTALYELELAGGGPQISNLRLRQDYGGHIRSQTTGSQVSDLRFQNLGVVRVRYRRLDTGAVEEIAHPIRASAVAKQFSQAGVRLRLAACVAEFAEILRGSPFAAGSEHSRVASELRPVALELGLDTRVQEFLRLVSGAHSLGSNAVQ